MSAKMVSMRRFYLQRKSIAIVTDGRSRCCALRIVNARRKTQKQPTVKLEAMPLDGSAREEAGLPEIKALATAVVWVDP